MPKSGRRSNPSPSDERKLARMFRNRPRVTSRTGNSVYLAVVLVDGIMILHLKSAARRFKLGHRSQLYNVLKKYHKKWRAEETHQHSSLRSVNHHHTGPVLKMDISFKFTEFYFIKENSFELQKLFLLPNCI